MRHCDERDTGGVGVGVGVAGRQGGSLEHDGEEEGQRKSSCLI